MELTARESIGKKIRTFRKLRDVSQVELAKQLGYTSTGTLSQVETGIRGMDIDKLPTLARILDVPLAVLVSDIDMTEDEVRLLLKLIDLIKNKNKSSEMKRFYHEVRKVLN
jgi:transcriptional regulator with XRE-family HTH domain